MKAQCSCRVAQASFSTASRSPIARHYQLLGVSSTASSTEIKKAYLALAQLEHPDKNPDTEAQARFMRINEAYNILSSKKGRTEYDKEQTHSPLTQWKKALRQASKDHQHEQVRLLWAEMTQSTPALQVDGACFDLLFQSCFDDKSLREHGVGIVQQAMQSKMVTEDVLLQAFNKLLYFCERQIEQNRSAPEDIQFIMDVISELEAAPVTPDMETYDMLDRTFAFAPHQVSTSAN
jgi:curved DNA-binding protein CbpA